MYVIIQQFILLGLPFLTIPYITRVLGPGGVGHYSYSFSIVTLVISIFLLGSNLYAVRAVAKIKDNQEELNKVFTEILVLRFSLMTVAGILYAILCNRYFDNDVVFYLQLIHIIGAAIDVTWLFQGLEKFSKVVVRNILIKLLGFGCVFIFVQTSADINKYTIIMGLSVLLGNLFLLWGLFKYVRFAAGISIVRYKPHLIGMLILFIPSFSALIYSVMDKTMIGILSTTEDVGYYDQAYKVVFMITSLINATGIVMLPRASNLIANNQLSVLKEVVNKGLIITLILVFPLVFGYIIIADEFIIWFMGDNFQESILISIIMAPTIIFKALGVVFGSWYLVPLQMNKAYTCPIVIGAIVNFVFNILFIPYYGAVGAAAVTLITEAIILLIQVWFLRREFEFGRLFKQYVLRYFLMGFIMFTSLFLLEFAFKRISVNFIRMGAEIIIGLIIYLGLLFITKDQQVLPLLKKIRRSN